MRKLWVLLIVASCSHTDSTQNGFDLEPGESRTFSFEGRPVSNVSVRATTGQVTVVITYKEKGVVKTSLSTSMSRSDDSIERVVVTGKTKASGYVEFQAK